MKSLFGLLVFFVLCTLNGAWAQESFPKEEALFDISLIPDVSPIPLNLPAVTARITYPPEAVVAGLEGLVQVQVFVDAFGNYTSHRVLRSPHVILSEAVRPFLSCLRFEAGTQAGQVMASFIMIPFRFSIRNSSQGRSKNGAIVPLECDPQYRAPIPPTMVKTH